jgi:hypothetical protein
VVVLANLSGFDGSPESMRELQLEYGAEIGRATVPGPPTRRRQHPEQLVRIREPDPPEADHF